LQDAPRAPVPYVPLPQGPTRGLQHGRRSVAASGGGTLFEIFGV
jgi:hypothetical protein